MGDEVGRVRRLSDDELLAGLSSALGSSRKWAALVLMHLAEVEERRLHLLAGHGSMFAYCTGRLGMSEDEACRRIAVAQLARRFPILYEGLAGGAISLSVAVLLKPHLTDANCPQLLRAVSGKTVGQAREVLAAWFPQPDVPTSIRKLPERSRTASSNGEAASAGGGVTLARGASAAPGSCDAGRAGAGGQPDARDDSLQPTGLGGIGEAASLAPRPALADATATATERGVLPLEPLRSTTTSPARPRASSAIEPLSPERYEVVFTADAELKRKLELARDLLRHSVPSGDLATILHRAFDLLIDETSRRRFATPRRSNCPPRSTSRSSGPGSAPVGMDDVGPAVAKTPVEPAAASAKATDPSIAMATPAPPAPPASRQSRHLPNSVRRTVLDRDGLRCTWRGPDGTRCESGAWLEHDHIDPRGKGGGDDPSNIRLRCRAHNRLTAEQTYGRRTIARIIARRRRQPPGVERQPPGVETHDDIARSP